MFVCKHMCIISIEFCFLVRSLYLQVDNSKWQCNEPLLSIQWNANGTLLAVVCKENRFFILTYQGNVVYDTQVPLPSVVGITAFTWAHDDHIVVATSGKLFCTAVLLYAFVYCLISASLELLHY